MTETLVVFDSVKTLAAGKSVFRQQCGALRMPEASPGQSYFILQFYY
jgi:hypothetical protein